MNATRPPSGDQLGEPLYPGPVLIGLASGPRPGLIRPSAGGRGGIGPSEAGCLQPVSGAASPAASRHRNSGVFLRRLLERIARRTGEWPFGEVDEEGRAPADLALHRDVAAVHLDDLLADGEPEAATPGRPRAVFVHPVEALEELIEVFRRDADARVSDAHGHPGGVVLHGDVNPVAGVRVLYGVVQQVEEDLVELLHVADAGVLVCVLEVHLDAEALGLRLDGPYGGPDDLPEVRRSDLELE